MTREIKMLLAVAAGAALAGWLVVRLVAPPAGSPVAAPPAETDEPVAVAETDEQVDEQDAAPSAPRELAASKAPDPGEDPSEEIAHDLDVLVRAIRKDKHVHNQSFPDDDTILDIPSLVPYIRKVNFWQPAFEKAFEDAKGDG